MTVQFLIIVFSKSKSPAISRGAYVSSGHGKGALRRIHTISQAVGIKFDVIVHL